jgi:hypothetical protein
MRKYIDEGNEIKESYDNAKETFARQHEMALRRFNDIHAQFLEFQKAYNLGEVTEEEFNEAKTEYERVEYTVNETGKRLDEIEKFRKEILMKILAKQNELKETYKMDIDVETDKLRHQLMKAKYDFLKLAVQLRKAYNKLSYEEYYHEKLKRELGLPSDVKDLNAFQALAPAVMDDGAAISYRELSHALYFGMIPEELENAMKEAESISK